MNRLIGTTPIKTPDSAVELYARPGNDQFRPASWVCELRWSEDLEHMISRQYRDLKFGNRKRDPKYRGWKSLPGTDRKWHDAQPQPSGDDHWFFEGRCNDFATNLILRLMAVGIPRGALSLVVGRVEHRDGTKVGHVVLVVHTTKGDLVCCNIVGAVNLGSDRLKYHRLTGEGCAMEDGPHWVSLDPDYEEPETATLEDLVRERKKA